MRLKHIIRDVDEGGDPLEETAQTEKFLAIIRTIKGLNKENNELRDKLYSSSPDPFDRRRLRGAVIHRSHKIAELLNDWRFETRFLDEIHEIICEQIDWLDEMNKKLQNGADDFSVSVKELRANLQTQVQFAKWARFRCDRTKNELGHCYKNLKTIQKKIIDKEEDINASSQVLKRILVRVEKGRHKTMLAKSELCRANLRPKFTVLQKDRINWKLPYYRVIPANRDSSNLKQKTDSLKQPFGNEKTERCDG